MKKRKTDIIQLIFEVKPTQWGLRGDPYLWEELKSYLMRNKAPKIAEEFEVAFRLAFKELTGKDLILNTDIYMGDYNKGGMSSGMVCSDYWIEVGLPLLIDRFKKIVKSKEVKDG